MKNTRNHLHVIERSRESAFQLEMTQPALRGVFGFAVTGLEGTLTATEGSVAGFVRLTMYFHGAGDPAMDPPAKMDAEVRECWAREVARGAASRTDEVAALVRELMVLASIPGQRTVRLSRAARSA